MTEEDIIRMAREAGKALETEWQMGGLSEEEGLYMSWAEEIAIRVAALVAAAEREACAKVCEDDESKAWDWSGNTRVGNYFARAIRARGDT